MIFFSDLSELAAFLEAQEPQPAAVDFPADIDRLEAALQRMHAAAERLKQDTRRALDKIEAAFTSYFAAVNNQDAPGTEPG